MKKRMKFKIQIVTIFLNLLVYTQSQKECSWDGFLRRPSIEIFPSRPGSDYPRTSNESISSVEDGSKSNNGASRKFIGCVHTSPIEWKVDVTDPNDFAMETTLYWKKKTNKVRKYYAYFILKQNINKRIAPSLFTCQPIPLSDGCDRNFLHSTEESDIWISNTPSVAFEEKARKLFSSPNVPLLGQKSENDCEFILSYRVEGKNSLEYKWERKLNKSIDFFKRVTNTFQPVYFQGLYRFVPQEPNCIKQLPEGECNDCNIIESDGSGLVFYVKSETSEMAFKGAFNISSLGIDGPRQFFWEWELAMEEMIHLESPSIFYVNHSMNVACTVSTLYFSFGAILKDEGLPNIVANPIEEKEVYIPDGMRVASKEFTFTVENTTKEIHCCAPLLNFTRRICKSVKVFVDIAEAPTFLSSEINKVLIFNEGDENIKLSCAVFGKPLPTLQWTLPNKDLKVNITLIGTGKEDHIIQEEIIIPRMLKELIGAYKCIASNFLANVSKTFTLELPPSGLTQGTKIGLSSGFGGVILLFIVILLAIYRKIMLQRIEYRTKTEEAIREFKEGIKTKEKIDKVKADVHLQHHVPIMEQPYNDDYEVPFECWNVEDKFLGQGAFGYVRKGTVKINNKNVQIAVKQMISAVEIEDFKSFLFELKIMAYIGHHPNIVSLVAACTNNIEQRDIMIGVEFCSNGSLMDYLCNKRSMFKLITAEPTRKLEISDSSQGTYSNLVHCISLTDLDLFIWSYQMAHGMEFLASKKVLHGDLATRNVLLTSDKTVKISDFGLSRILQDSSNYTKKSKAPLPWRWMSIEAIKSLTFSHSSDVWAYGITLWEIFTLGESPYAGMHFGPEFIQQLEQGMRLNKPTKATEYVYNIMKSCWEESPANRLTFTQLKQTFSQLLDTVNNPSSNGPNQPYPVPRPRNRQTVDKALEINQLYTNIRASNLYLNV